MGKKRFWSMLILLCAGLLMTASVASAAVTKVICVPWQGNVLADHNTWDGKTILLKAVVLANDNSLLSYTWEFGDGTGNVTGTVTGSTKYNFQVFHAYAGSLGTPYIATLTVSGGGATISDTYRVRVKEYNLDTERAVAVDDALWWLYKDQSSNGQWYTGSYGGYVANTASAVHAFEVNNHLASGNADEDPYVTAVANGLAFIFTRLQAVSIGAQTYGNPDSNGNGLGIQVNEDYPPYQGGPVMDAIINTRTPDAIAASGPANVTGRKYKDIVQDMIDMYAWGQSDYGDPYGGGWRYSWGDFPDNSACQWAAIGMIPAQRTWALTVPQWVKDRNNVWLNYSYYTWSGIYGGFGYTGPSYGDALSPSGMVQLAFDGKTRSDERWVRTERWLADSWNSWRDSYNYYAYYAGFKALTLALPEPVQTFYNGFDWYRGTASVYGLAKRLIEDQNRSTTDGNSRGVFRDYYGTVFGTSWATVILSGFEAQPVAVVSAHPNPTAQDVPVTFDHSASYHLDPSKIITLYEYDWDNNGSYDYSTGDKNEKPTHVFHCATYPTPCTFVVALRVTDNSSPVKRNTTTINIQVTPPPHDPTAVVGGPYFACPGVPVTLDGSHSYDIDAPEGDYIASYAWEFTGDHLFNDAIGAIVTHSFAAGNYDIGLKVTDSYGRTNNAWTTLTSNIQYCCTAISNLTATPKSGKVQLVWTHVGGTRYDIYRSDNGGGSFAKIGETTSTYSTYLDSTVTNGQTYVYYVKNINGLGCDSNRVTVTVRVGR